MQRPGMVCTFLIGTFESIRNWKSGNDEKRRKGIRHMISVVDDDAFVRQATANLLNSYGFEVAAFSSAEDFLTSKSVDNTQCLITDVQMPGLSGLDLQQHLVGRGKAMPIIFITAFPSETLRAKAIETGAAGFFAKPFAERSLVECVKRALNGGSLA